MRKFTVLLSSVFLLPASGHAELASSPDAAAEPNAQQITVTATRTPTPIDKIAASVTVLDKTDIDRAQDIGVTELLLRTPGISMSRNGGYGTATSLRIRGAETDQTVVVIDGVKLNDPASAGGGYNFAHLLLGDAARIEILRGPQSILWGSQAIGGVVNVVTALPETKLGTSFDIEAGSRETINARAALGGVTGPLTWRVAANRFTTDGISAISPAFGGREPDGYTNRSFTGRTELAIAEGVQFDLRGYYSRGRTDIDATTSDNAEYGINREFVGYAGLNVALLDGRLRNRLGYGYTDTSRDNFNPIRARPQTFDSAGKTRRFEYQGDLAISDHWNAVFGAETERSRFRSVSPAASLAVPIPNPARGSARITSFYGQLNGEIVTGLTLSGGIRHDDHSQFGGKTLVSAGGVWVLPTRTIVRASYGEGFKAPTLFQLFSEFGNQALAPERAHGWEAGIEQHLFDKHMSLGLTYFERQTSGQIIFNSCPAVSTLPLCFRPGTTTSRSGYYQNVARAETTGIEATARAQLNDNFVIDGNFSWIRAEDRSPGTANFGNWLPRRPRYQANGSATYLWPFGLSTGVAVRWSGSAFDNAANSLATRLDDYTLVDLRAELPLSSSIRLFGRVENLFDRHYMTAYRYGTLGRSVYAGMRARL